jgi:hypothetical protein
MYIGIHSRFWDAVRRKYPLKWGTNNWFLLHDNAPPHSRFCQGFLSKEQSCNTGTFPWLAPDDCFLFLRLQSALKGRRFCGATDIINNATEELKRVSQNRF